MTMTMTNMMMMKIVMIMMIMMVMVMMIMMVTMMMMMVVTSRWLIFRYNGRRLVRRLRLREQRLSLLPISFRRLRLRVFSLNCNGGQIITGMILCGGTLDRWTVYTGNWTGHCIVDKDNDYLDKDN